MTATRIRYTDSRFDYIFKLTSLFICTMPYIQLTYFFFTFLPRVHFTFHLYTFFWFTLSQWSAQLPSPSVRSVLTSPPRADKRQGLDGHSSLTMGGGMNTSYDSYTLHINAGYVQESLEERIKQSRVVVQKNPLVATSQSEVRLLQL